MPIGDQTYGEVHLTQDDLRAKYDYIIKEALQKANPKLTVIRADEELNPSCISNDIFTKLMHSQYVIADVTYPNPNVFYELGIRHAISPRTILIREKDAYHLPFDISHLRCHEYTTDNSGMSKLAEQFKKIFDWYDRNSNKPDNQFLDLCAFTNYSPVCYATKKDPQTALLQCILPILLSNPSLFTTIMDKNISDEEKQKLALLELSQNPEKLVTLTESMMDSGLISF